MMTEGMINIGDWIKQWAMIKPYKIAIISDDIPYTYRQLNRRINRLSHLFLEMGLKKGDRVAVLLHNCKQFIEIFFSLSKLGGILVPLNWRLAIPELEFIIKDSGSDTLIFEDVFTSEAEELRKRTALRHYVSCTVGEGLQEHTSPLWARNYETSIDPCADDEPSLAEPTGDRDPHIIMYTSGTTGLPKGALLSHRKTFFNVLNSDMFFDLTTRDIMIIARPIFHSGGLIVESAPVLYKGGTIIVKKRLRPLEILETIQKYRVTILELPATVYQFILNECNLEQFDLSSLRCCFTGGERIPIPLLQALAKKGLIISQIYGLTEASTLFWLPTEEAKEKMGSVGHPIFHGRVRIVDREGRDVQPGETGEIAVKGPIVMTGYWNRKDLTEEVIKDGWLFTGDLAKADEEGFVYIVDRKKDMFISGGENVYPAEIEKVLLGHPKINNAAVVGVSDKKWGEVGKAYIVPRNGERITTEEVIDYLKGRVAKYKIPKYIQFEKNLPITASGKIQKHLLKEQNG
jgi:fatty-acyl-CoA synthase